MTLEAFVRKHTELLQLERETEIAETSALVDSVPLKELQRRGVCLLRLHPSNQSTGLYGRTLVTFAPSKGHGDGTLPSHGITPGDIVGVCSSQRGGASASSSDPSGIVSRVTQTTVTVAFDHSTTEGAVSFEHDNLYRLTKLANDVTYRRLKRALSDLEAYSSGPSRHLIDVLFGETEPSPPSLPRSSSGEHTDETELRFFNDHLNESQREAVTFALCQRDVAIIHGPPGTGKTTTVMEIIRQAVQRKIKVLACAPSNVAVDNLVEKLAAAKVRLVRLGHPARLLPAIQRYALDAILASSEGAQIVRDVRRDIDQTRVLLSKCKQSGEKRRLREEARALRKELAERERRAVADVLGRAQVVLATTAGATPTGPLGRLPDDHFGLAVVDECAQATEASCWVPLLHAPCCVLAGDHHQLPPTIISERAARDGLAVSLMERATALHGDSVTSMLTTQYRMNSAIMRWSSEALYGGRLTAATAAAGRLLSDLPGVEATEDTTSPLILVDTSGCDLPELEPDADSPSASRANEGEADLVAGHVRRLLAAGLPPADIAVIAPYNLQVELLRLRLSGHHPELEIKSVDGFQGREKEAVVISLVRSNPKGEVGFLAEDRRINVAVTRARRHVAVICDSETVGHHGFLKNLVEYMEAHGSVRSAYQYQDEMDGCSVRHDRGAKPRPKEKHHKIPGDGKRKYDPAKSAQKEAELTEQMQRFHEDLSRDRLVFPSSLNSHDRLIVHQMAEKLGLHHFSVGEGQGRQLTVTRQRNGTDLATEEMEKDAMKEDADAAAMTTQLRTENKTDAVITADENIEEEEVVQQGRGASMKDAVAKETPQMTTPGNGASMGDAVAKEMPQMTSPGNGASMGDAVAKEMPQMTTPGNGLPVEVAMQGKVTKATAISPSNKNLDAKRQSAGNCRSLPNSETEASVPEMPRGSVKAKPEEMKKRSDPLPRNSGEEAEHHHHRCQFCRKKLPPGNLLLHEIHCEKLTEEKRRRVEAPRTNKAAERSKRRQWRDTLETADAEDFDGLLAAARTTDTRCNVGTCGERVALTGLHCGFCNRRYCFGHGLPEVHGCGQQARSQARRTVAREGEVRSGSGPRERKVDGDRRAQLERKLGKKKAEMTDKRTKKASKKK